MRFASLSTPTYSTPRMAGLQAQASTENVAPQKAEAFTPSGRIQRQGKTTRKHVEMLIAAIDTHLKEAIDASKITINSISHLHELRQQRQSLQDQLKQPSKKGISRLFEWISGGKKFSCENGYFAGLDLRGLDFRGADFTDASFAGANLDGASLRHTRLKGTRFNSAFLCHTSFKGARISRRGSNPTIFYGAYDLDKAHGLPKGIDISCESLEARW